MANQPYQIVKDPTEQTAEELAESWVNGNRSYVLATLALAHPCVTALIMLETGLLSVIDRRAIANGLIDLRVDLNEAEA